MNCQYCKDGSMDPVSSGNTQINQCDICGAVWFDKGEIRELIEGRFPKADETEDSLISEFTGERGQRSGIPVPVVGGLTGRLTGGLAAGLEEKIKTAMTITKHFFIAIIPNKPGHHWSRAPYRDSICR